MPKNERTAAVIGRVFREAREEAGVTQQEVAMRAGMDRAYVNQVENGKRSVSMDRLLKMCASLGVRAGKLVERIERELKREK